MECGNCTYEPSYRCTTDTDTARSQKPRKTKSRKKSCVYRRPEFVASDLIMYCKGNMKPRSYSSFHETAAEYCKLLQLRCIHVFEPVEKLVSLASMFAKFFSCDAVDLCSSFATKESHENVCCAHIQFVHCIWH